MHPKLLVYFTVDGYDKVGDEYLEIILGNGVPLKVFQTELDYRGILFNHLTFDLE